MLQEQLKQATKDNHDQLEQLMHVNNIMSGTLSLAQYKHLLTTNYLVHQAFEDFIYNSLSPQLANQLAIPQRHKLQALVDDLHELKIPIPTQDTDSAITFNKNDAELLGAMYVLEGATLGGSVIVKRLKTNAELNNANLNFNYYQVYGDQLIPYWKKFCEILNQQPETSYSPAISGAKKMFEYIATVQQQNNVAA